MSVVGRLLLLVLGACLVMRLALQGSYIHHNVKHGRVADTREVGVQGIHHVRGRFFGKEDPLVLAEQDVVDRMNPVLPSVRSVRRLRRYILDHA